MLERQARAWPNLHFVAGWNSDREAGRDRVALPRCERNILRRHDIETGSVFRRPRRKRKPCAVRQPLKLDLDQFDFLALRAPFFAGPFAALASIRRTASSRVMALGSAPFGKVACVVPSLA